MKCPKHQVSMEYTKTKYGKRYFCPIAECTVACWEGSTSTPADDKTRAKRNQAHAVFDPLHKSKKYKRGTLYKMLAGFLGIEQEKAHIGMFDHETCEKVIEWTKTL